MEWISVKEGQEPKGNVLGFVDGRYRAIVFYVKKHKEQAEWEFDPETHNLDYDEENDIYYWPEGWYEEIEQFSGEYDIIWAPRKVTHWRILPEPPKP